MTPLGLDNRIAINWATVVLLTVVLLPSSAPAQSGGDYILEWSTIDGGGGRSSSGPYVLTGTIGQPDAGWSSGGGYELSGGFWPRGPLCIVDFHHYARFAEWWMVMDCNEQNVWCGGADLNKLGDVDEVDLDLFVDEWLYYCAPDWPLK
jgi:hypothetical protein